LWFRNVTNNNNKEDDDEMESLYREMISNDLFVGTLQIRVFECNCHPIGEGGNNNNNDDDDDEEMESLYREMIRNDLFVYTLQIRVFECNCHPIGGDGGSGTASGSFLLQSTENKRGGNRDQQKDNKFSLFFIVSISIRVLGHKTVQ